MHLKTKLGNTCDCGAIWAASNVDVAVLDGDKVLSGGKWRVGEFVTFLNFLAAECNFGWTINKQSKIS